MSNDDNIRNEQNDTFDSKPKKLRSTKGLHLGNHYSDKLNIGDNESTTCIRCSKCKNTFGSKTEFDLHIHKCNT